jgi:hypothetical protein
VILPSLFIYIHLFLYFFTGPYIQKVCLFLNETLINGTTLEYNPALGENITELNFEGLHYGNKYHVCLETLVVNSYNKVKTCKEYQAYTKCRDVETRCEKLPATKNIPSQTLWSAEESFNPFNEIKIRMEKGTFDGEKSGLSNFKMK